MLKHDHPNINFFDLFPYQRKWNELESAFCGSWLGLYTNEFLCEKRSSVALRTPTIPFANVPNLSQKSYITCPAGHVTHDYFACDPQSACFMDGDDKNARCLAGLTPLPPSFSCSSSEMRVPYTVVCDFRPDCLDRSDEDFCYFPPCSGDTIFDCGNGQVQSMIILFLIKQAKPNAFETMDNWITCSSMRLFNDTKPTSKELFTVFCNSRL